MVKTEDADTGRKILNNMRGVEFLQKNTGQQRWNNKNTFDVQENLTTGDSNQKQFNLIYRLKHKTSAIEL